MNMPDRTLFSEIQGLFERTYARVGVNLEDCLIGQERCAELSRAAGAAARELSTLARTFLRRSENRLYVGIYYSQWIIQQLESHDPRKGISDENIRSLIVFVEEINHALHAALHFESGAREIESEDFARNLELQAYVDTYMVLLLFVGFFRRTQRVSRTDRRWLRFHLFESESGARYHSDNLRERYAETTELARVYTEFLDGLNASRRLDEIRRFRALDYPQKRQCVLLLNNSPDDTSA